MGSIILLAKAVSFCAEKHVSQRRKGAAQEPYINHLVEVASLVANATGGQDVNLVAAAYLHDTLEDTDTTYEELVSQFNEDIAQLVAEMTDDKSLPKQRRKELQVENASKKSNRAKIIKLADKTSNLRSLAASPPADWEIERVGEYVIWAKSVCDQFRGNNVWLDEQFDEAVERLDQAFTPTGFIDPPSPFAPLSEWEKFAAEMEEVQGTVLLAKELLAQAREIIAEKKKQGENGSESSSSTR